jgi:hypothetical protein
MKPAILITTHPNTKEKEYILQNFGDFIKQFNLDSFVFSNHPVSKNSQSKFTGTYSINYNPSGPSPGVVWKSFSQIKGTHNRIIPNWCYSFMNLILSGAKILKSLGYTHFIFLIYDTELNQIKVKNFIDYALNNLVNKKGIFTEYEKDWVNSLSTSQCACEIDFFISTFEPTLSDYYQGKYSLLAELYWFEIVTQCNNKINIISNKDLILNTIYNSAATSTINKSNYWLGYSSQKDQTILTYQFPFINNLKIYKEDIEIFYIEEIYGDIFKVIYFTSDPFSKYYISYENKPKEFLFEDTPFWRSHNYYKFLNG